MTLADQKRVGSSLLLLGMLALCPAGCALWNGGGGGEPACAEEGETCTVDADCCTDLLCGEDGVCAPEGGGEPPCADEGETCTADADCCIDLLCGDDGVCAPEGGGEPACAEEGETCTVDADCCIDLLCGDDGACTPEGGGSSTPPGEAVQSEKERITSPDVPQTDLDDLVAGNSGFAFDLYQQVRGDEDGNIFYSPYSISVALAMTYAGARNETEQQMADTLRFTLPQDRLHPAFNALDLELASRAETTSDEDGEGFRLNIVNRIWGRIGYSFLDEFLDVLAENYGAGLYVLDFVGAPEESRIVINDWVSDQTEERIQDLIPPRAITPLTVLVLTNAIYFKAVWNEPFDETLTQDGLFHLLDGGEVTVPMMRQEAAFGYAAGDGYQVVELPYDGEELSMVVFLPDADRFEEFETTLDAEAVEAAVQDLAPHRIDLTMPRFTFEWDASLKDVLSALGMSIAFIGDADFSGMNERGGLFISDVIHKAFVAVDEEGTEAAAATAVIMVEGAAPMPEVVVTIDRPFVFLIRDLETGAILFVGRVVNPS